MEFSLGNTRKKAIHPIPGALTIRLAQAKDKQKIIGINEEIFERDEEVQDYIRKEQIFLFEKDKEIIGFGIFARVIEGRQEFDIGMLVDRKYRRQGYGEFITRYLVNHCQKNGWRAICGCAIENTGSRRCLENAGFISRYRLLEFAI
ncbi:MAG: GNAT family N-acetyltransferase [Anaerolineales bacterium]|nr:GNAT family N-acetyltransferase [Anaerolineales bacterium]